AQTVKIMRGMAFAEVRLTMSRVITLLLPLGLWACSSGPCATSATEACEKQCAPGIAGGICYPDPVCDPTGNWQCHGESCCRESELTACRRKCNCTDDGGVTSCFGEAACSASAGT